MRMTFVAGLIVGVFLGVLVMALAVAATAGHEDRQTPP